MAQHDHVRVTLQRANGVRQRLPLRHRRVLDLVYRYDASSKTLHRRGERRRRPGRRLVEKIGEDLPLQEVERADPGNHRLHLVRHLEYVVEIAGRELTHRDDVPPIPRGVLLIPERQMASIHTLSSLRFLPVPGSPFTVPFSNTTRPRRVTRVTLPRTSIPSYGVQSHRVCRFAARMTQLSSVSTSTAVSGSAGSPKSRCGLVTSRSSMASRDIRPSCPAVSRSGTIVSTPGNPGGGDGECFSAHV